MPTRVIQIEECQLMTYEKPTEKMVDATGVKLVGELKTKSGTGWIVDADHLLMPVERQADRWHLRQLRAMAVFTRLKKAIPGLLIHGTILYWCVKCRNRHRHEMDGGLPAEIEHVFFTCDNCGPFSDTKWFGDVWQFDVEWFSFSKEMHS